ncbi:hypothetical protein Q0Z83_057820 [Actinoplanes sichuanensis]|uniref:Uncharacterized protein n=1 Tax=Actinoplanes sichuanensis TaxID=512349 RepID=A0ABW4A5B2_9ACTN|nr:hypothetical protein [Actinoplanes sichuanensis]BEL07591.1 hypothetical protein Q0Z83_057820 [Actinoplanes sichuanensis]
MERERASAQPAPQRTATAGARVDGGPRKRSWVGAVAAAVPHVVVLGLTIAAVVAGPGREHEHAGLGGVLEVYLVPVGLLTSLFLCFVPRWRRYAGGIAVSTVSCGIVVVLAAMIIGGAGTWE